MKAAVAPHGTVAIDAPFNDGDLVKLTPILHRRMGFKSLDD
ncbi:MAG: hypothetical protein AB1714_03350 [Acidobacteriota bacterium]